MRWGHEKGSRGELIPMLQAGRYSMREDRWGSSRGDIDAGTHFGEHAAGEARGADAGNRGQVKAGTYEPMGQSSKDGAVLKKQAGVRGGVGLGPAITDKAPGPGCYGMRREIVGGERPRWAGCQNPH